jgi:hypothetical protein
MEQTKYTKISTIQKFPAIRYYQSRSQVLATYMYIKFVPEQEFHSPCSVVATSHKYTTCVCIATCRYLRLCACTTHFCTIQQRRIRGNLDKNFVTPSYLCNVLSSL